MASNPIAVPEVDESALYDLLCRADEIGLRLEMSETGFHWEAAPGQRHQEILLSVTNSIAAPTPGKSSCKCHRIMDIFIRFPDGVIKRPDVAIFWARPPEDEGFIHEIPEAVVEITSPGYEDKDLIEGPPIYLRNGVKDVLVLDRRSNKVHHWTGTGRQSFPCPHLFSLTCGCQVTV